MTTRKSNTRVYVAVLAVAMILLGIVLLLQLDSKASYVIIGIVFGVAASIPTSLLIVAASRQSQSHSHQDIIEPVEAVWRERIEDTTAVVIFNPDTLEVVK